MCLKSRQAFSEGSDGDQFQFVTDSGKIIVFIKY